MAQIYRWILFGGLGVSACAQSRVPSSDKTEPTERAASSESIDTSVSKKEQESPASQDKALPASEDSIERLIGSAACVRHADCAMIAIGHRACGGPERYLAYSKRHTNEAELRALVERYTDQQKRSQIKSRTFSICSIVEKPGGVACRDQKCVLVTKAIQ